MQPGTQRPGIGEAARSLPSLSHPAFFARAGRGCFGGSRLHFHARRSVERGTDRDRRAQRISAARRTRRVDPGCTPPQTLYGDGRGWACGCGLRQRAHFRRGSLRGRGNAAGISPSRPRSERGGRMGTRGARARCHALLQHVMGEHRLAAGGATTRVDDGSAGFFDSVNGQRSRAGESTSIHPSRILIATHTAGMAHGVMKMGRNPAATRPTP
jgi:hypothetical protein